MGSLSKREVIDSFKVFGVNLGAYAVGLPVFWLVLPVVYSRLDPSSAVVAEDVMHMAIYLLILLPVIWLLRAYRGISQRAWLGSLGFEVGLVVLVPWLLASSVAMMVLHRADLAFSGLLGPLVRHLIPVLLVSAVLRLTPVRRGELQAEVD